MTRPYLMAHPRRSLFRVLATATVEGAAFLFVIAVVFVAMWLTAP